MLFQDLILKLQNYWGEKGCIILQPYDIEKGAGLSRPLSTLNIFPYMLIEMISVGEETCELDTILSKTSQFYDDEVDTVISRLTTLIEPVVIVLLAGIVGFIIISIVLPMLDMYQYMG